MQSIKTFPQRQVIIGKNRRFSAFSYNNNSTRDNDLGFLAPNSLGALNKICLLTAGCDTFLISFVGNHGFFSAMAELRPHLLKLMERPKIPWRATLEPEQRICVDFADTLREYTLTGRLTAVWHHCPNEGKRHPIVALILKAMGLLPGVGDYPFSWKDGSGYIEIKTTKGTQTPYQKAFGEWCKENGVKYEICRSSEEALETLQSWGVISKGRGNL